MVKRIFLSILATITLFGQSAFALELSKSADLLELNVSNERVKIYAENERLLLEKDYIDRIIIKYKPNENSQENNQKVQTAVESVKAFQNQEESGLFNNNTTLQSFEVEAKQNGFVVVQLEEKMDPSMVLQELDSEIGEFVEYIQPDYVMELSADLQIEDPVQNERDGDVEAQHSFSNAVTAELEQAHKKASGDGVTVAVIDTGIDTSHPFLDGKFVDGYDFYNDSATVYDNSAIMDQVHGTHVAGIIAQTVPDAKIMPLKCFQNGKAYTSDIIEAMNYAAEHGADVVNCSWGSVSYNEALKETMQNSGLFFVCAAGNNRHDLSEELVYPACFNLDNSISVASVNNDSGFSYFSNYSTEYIDIAAYGRDIESTYINGEYGTLSGTSMSAAYVSGAAAMAMQLGETNVKNRIKGNADRLSNLQDMVHSGNKLNFVNLVSNISSSKILDVQFEEDFNADGYEPTSEESWQLYCSLDNIQIEAGGTHVVVLKSNGTVWTWGNSDQGQRGKSTKIPSGIPSQITHYNLTDIIQIAAGDQHNLALKADGTVWAWGYNGSGRLGTGTTTTSLYPVKVQGLTSVEKIYANEASMAIKTDGSVYAWGPNDGRYGNGSSGYSTFPILVSNLNSIEEISLGSNFGVALKNDGNLISWGDNTYGQLGNNTNTNSLSPVPIQGISGVTKISCGAGFALALISDGTVYAWGQNTYGQLGDETFTNRKVPAAVKNATGITHITAGYQHTILVKSGDKLLACGNNTNGECGMESFTSVVNSLKEAQYIGTVSMISGGKNFSTALTEDNAILTWGDNLYGQLGDGTEYACLLPTQVKELTDITKIGIGYTHVLALKSDGTVWAWGDNAKGQLGIGKVSNFESKPVQVQGLTDVMAVAAGKQHSVALKSDGTVWVWGSNNFGQLGVTSIGTGMQTTPIKVAALSNVKEIAAADWCTYAIKSDGTLWTVGYGGYGFGDGTYQRTQFAQVSGILNAAEISCYGHHTLMRKTDGTVWAWGLNSYGALGDNTSTTRRTIGQVQNISDAKQISAGVEFSMAVKQDGTAWAWGGNRTGQLGIGSYTTQLLPVAMSGLTNVIKISAGYEHGVAVKNDGTVWTWGANDAGELGKGNNTIYRSPTKVASLSDISDIAAGTRLSLALKSDGTVWAWGINDYGQIGNGRNFSRTMPYRIGSKINDTGSESQDAHSIDALPGTTVGGLEGAGDVDWYQFSGNSALDLKINIISNHNITAELYEKISDTQISKINNNIAPKSSKRVYLVKVYAAPEISGTYVLRLIDSSSFETGRKFLQQVENYYFYSDFKNGGQMYKSGLAFENPTLVSNLSNPVTWLVSNGTNIYCIRSGSLYEYRIKSDTFNWLKSCNAVDLVCDDSALYLSSMNDGGRIYRYDFETGYYYRVCNDLATDLILDNERIIYRNQNRGGKLYFVPKSAKSVTEGIYLD